MLVALSTAALAVPPRGEVIAGFAGNADHGYAFTTFQPAIVRGEDGEASFVARATASELYYTYVSNGVLYSVRSPGLSMGPGFVLVPGDFTLSASVGLEARRPSPEDTVELDASLSGGVQWRPQERASLYAQSSFSAAQGNVWIRLGALYPVYPFTPRDTALSLWLGIEGTTVGTGETRVQELGAVVDVPIRDLHASVSFRAGLASQQLGPDLVRRGTAGVGIYWFYY